MRTLKNRLTFGLFLTAMSVFGQEFDFDIHHTTLDEYIRMEEDLGSERLPVTSKHVSLSGDAPPVKFRREEKDIPDALVYYFFKKKDSTMSTIRYEWSIKNFDKASNNPQDEKTQKSFVKKYRELEKLIDRQYGKGEINGSIGSLEDINTKSGVRQENIWHPDDSTEVKMSIVMSNFYEKKGIITTPTVHRIRLHARAESKEKSNIPDLTEKRVDSLNIEARNFLKTLKSKDIAGTRKFFSDLIKDKVTNEQMTSLIENIDFDRKIELYYKGAQFGSDGSVYTILQYKYAGDMSNPPRETVKIVFDDKGKIAGVRPMRLQAKISD